MEIIITIELNPTDLEQQISLYPILMKDIFFKYNIDVINDSQKKKLNCLANEISLLKRDLVVFNACNSLTEIVHLNNDLKSFNLALTTVFIPSKERITKRISEAREIAHLHGRWIGSSEEEVEKNFKEFKAVLQEIKEGLKDTAIEVIEC